MPKLQITDDAVRATYTSPYSDNITNKAMRAALELAAPLIVAAELERLAPLLADRGSSADLLRERAAELRRG